MDEVFRSDLYSQILREINNGRRQFVLWGFNTDCIWLLSEMNTTGLSQFVMGIVDSNSAKWGAQVFQYTVMPPEKISEINIDVLVITVDAEKEDALRQFAKVDVRKPKVLISGIKHQAYKDPEFDDLLSSGLVKSYATGNTNTQIHLYQTIKYLADSSIHASVVEFGIFKGGTIAFLARTLRHFGFTDTKIYGLDIFEGFPPSKSVLDMYSNPECEYRDYSAVLNYCHQYGVTVIKGDICKTYEQLRGIPLMLSFFDTDNYSPTHAALEMCFEQTVKGGVLAFDHYFSVDRFADTLGERLAAQEVLHDKKVFNLHGTGIFLKL